MTDVDAMLLLAFVLALGAAALLTPCARRLGLACNLLDHATDWKTHRHPTPYLGGAAVLLAFALGAVLAPDLRAAAILLTVAFTLSLVGTVDDALRLDVRWRLLSEVAAGGVLWAAGYGWRLDVAEGLNLILTCLWVVAVINALNLIDLMDTVASGVLFATAGGLALLAYLEGQTTAAVMCVALTGGILGFLPYNVSPARIFLGDGGTMGLGFLLAGLTLLALGPDREDAAVLLVTPVLVLVPLSDAAWRAVKRIRRGVSIMTAGHDSVANDVLRHVGTPPRVGLLLAAGQAVCSTAAVLAIYGDAAIAATSAALLLGAISLAWLRVVASADRLRRVGAPLSRE
jgi:UDP-GlcNAc:undecaprenyl-phosphate/decaprenyl-phosphate GlcNAc-1-phosphate transferase